MKKTVSFVLTIIMMATLVACGDSDEVGDSSWERSRKSSESADDSDSTESSDSSKRSEVSELDAPGNVSASYNAGTATVEIKWSAVSGATAYEFCYDGTNYNKTESTSGSFKNPEEGVEYTIKVRALHEEGKTILLSDDATCKCNVPVSLGKPSNLVWSLDGNTGDFYWEAADNADEYEVTVAGKSFTTTENKLTLKGLQGDSEYDVSVKAKRTSNGRTYESESISAKVSVPSVNPDNYDIYTNVFLDYESLKQALTAKNLVYTEFEKDGMSVIDVQFVDPKNQGFLNNLLRIAGAALESYVADYFGSVGNKIDKDFADILSTIETIANSDSVKDYFKSVGETSHENASTSAFISGLSAFFADTNIHYQYYYANKNRGACYELSYRLYNNNESYEKDTLGKFTLSDDGLYHLQDNNYKRKFAVKCAKTDIDGNACWCTLVYRE